MTVQQAIANELLTRLNANTIGVQFNAETLIQYSADKFILEQHPTFYQTEIKKYTPTMFNFVETQKNIKDMDITDFSISVEFILNGSPSNRQKELDAIEQFRLSLINDSLFIFAANNNGYNAKSSATGLTPLGNIEFRGSAPRIRMSMNVYIQSGIGIRFGDNEKFELRKLNDSVYGNLDWVEIFCFNKDSGTAKDYTPKQTNSDIRAIGIPNGSIWQGKKSLPYNNNLQMHQKLYDICQNPKDEKEKFELRITKPNGGVIEEKTSSDGVLYSKDVGIHGTIVSVTGTAIQLELTLTEV